MLPTTVSTGVVWELRQPVSPEISRQSRLTFWEDDVIAKAQKKRWHSVAGLEHTRGVQLTHQIPRGWTELRTSGSADRCTTREHYSIILHERQKPSWSHAIGGWNSGVQWRSFAALFPLSRAGASARSSALVHDGVASHTAAHGSSPCAYRRSAVPGNCRPLSRSYSPTYAF
ncbi:hypothetical protein SKAU_G00356080 [Synaphobranchus kaupii]|uniref:Uncharacterized protein n=1 Tax=Synaphobranchus kaupii TaxID=118154 RepID=A0A9Q1IGF7_SYNKA|nr:hypothetical protein SKAU_G00356080 [Synaphobranchus kaupii]